MAALKLFFLVVSMSALSLGGGAYLMTGLERALVGGGVLSPGQFAAGVAIGQSTPGPMASFTAAVGNAALGVSGAVAATAALLVVSLGAVLLLQWVPVAWFQAPRVQGALKAIQPFMAGVALYLGVHMALAGVGEGTTAARPLVPLLILGAVVAGRLRKVPTPVLVGGAVILGMLLQGSSWVGW
jgi:chromate transport protein ChrA